MKKSEIQIGSIYIAKVSGKLTRVRVDAIRDYCAPVFGKEGRWEKRYDVTNLATGRKTTFRSAAKFRCLYADKSIVGASTNCPYCGQNRPLETNCTACYGK